MFNRMSEDMDVNCGTVIDGEETVEQVGKRVFELVLKTASGSKSKSELNGYGDEEFNPWQVGVVM
jgi:altronate dehydratase